MTTAETLNALAGRVEREKPSRELDAAVLAACGHQAVNRGPRMGWEYRPNRVGIWQSMPSPTTSLDSAVTLVPEWLHWEVAFVHIGEHPTTPLASAKLVGGLTHVNCEASTPAAALTAAALRARAAMERT